MPGAAVLISGAALITWMRPRSPRPPTIAVLSTLCAFGLAMGIFRFVNLTAYGSFAGVDSQESNFVGAMQALQNVRVGKPIPYLPVSRPARLKIYEISPAFASLKKYLDPPGTPVWQWGCAPYPLTCGDIAGGWFFWALRDAVAAGALRIIDSRSRRAVLWRASRPGAIGMSTRIAAMRQLETRTYSSFEQRTDIGDSQGCSGGTGRVVI